MAAVGQCVVRLAGRSCNSSGTTAHICASVPDVRPRSKDRRTEPIHRGVIFEIPTIFGEYNWTASKIVELFNFSTNARVGSANNNGSYQRLLHASFGEERRANEVVALKGSEKYAGRLMEC